MRADTDSPDPVGTPRTIVSIPAPTYRNPYQRLLYEQLEAQGIKLVPEPILSVSRLLARRRSPPILHFHWPEAIYRDELAELGQAGAWTSWLAVMRFGVRLAVARLLGYRIIWTVHEVVPHESRGRCDWVASCLLARASHKLIVHEQSTADDCLRLPSARSKIVRIPHATYDGFYGRERTGAEVRQSLSLGWARFVFLSFGRICPYKRIPLVLEAFRRTAAELPEAALVIAGLPEDPAVVECVESAAESDYRIRPLLRFISDYEVADLFAAADACVYARDGGTSGTVLLGLSLGTPVVAARVPAYEELIGDETAGWLFTAGDPEALQATLIRAADPATAAVRGMRAGRMLSGRDWPTVGRRTAEVLLEV